MIRPLSDNVVIKAAQVEQKSLGGIIIPNAESQKQSIAEVIAVGPGALDKKGNLVPTTVKPGDTVIYNRNKVHEYVDEKKETYLIVSHSDILAVLKK